MGVAKKEVDIAVDRVNDRKDDLATAKTNQKEAEKHLSDAADHYDKARKVWGAAADKAAEKKTLNENAEAEAEKKSADVLSSARQERDKIVKAMNDKLDDVKKT